MRICAADQPELEGVGTQLAFIAQTLPEGRTSVYAIHF